MPTNPLLNITFSEILPDISTYWDLFQTTGWNENKNVDLIIHPDHQGTGLGSQLPDRLVSKCKEHRIRDIQLFAARDKAAFYERFGFEPPPVNAPGMQYRY